jgi:dipeptide/tripeptide permease
MSRLERAGFAVVLGIFWAWMMIQDLADRYGWDAPLALAAGILAASVALWYGILLLLERLTDDNGHHPAEIRDSDQCQRR